MATGELVADTNLTLLGNIDLCHLQDAGGQLVADGDGKLLALVLCVEQLELLQVIDNELGNELVLMFIVSPVAYLYVAKLKVLQVVIVNLAPFEIISAPV